MKQCTLIAATLLSAFAFGQSVTKVDLARDNGRGKPGPVVKSFAPTDDPIHCVMYLKPLTGSTVFTGTLTAVDAGKIKDYLVATTNVSGVMRAESIDFRFANHRPWPVGSYRIDIKVSGRLLKSMPFDVK